MEKCNFCCGLKKPEEIAWISRGKNTLLVKCKDCVKAGKFIPNIPERIDRYKKYLSAGPAFMYDRYTQHGCKPPVDSGNDRGTSDSDSGVDADMDKDLDNNIQQEG